MKFSYTINTSSVKPIVLPKVLVHQFIKYEKMAIHKMLPKNEHQNHFFFSWKLKTCIIYIEWKTECKLNVNWGIFKTMPVLLWPVDYRTYPREYTIFKCHIHTYFYNPCITIMEEWTWLYCSSCDFEFHPTSMEVTSVWVKYWGVILPCYLKLI